MNKILIFIIFILSSFTFTAQNKIDIKGKVKAKIINKQNSNLLIATSKATYGIDPQTQHLKWTSKKLKKVIYKSYMELGETSLVLLEKKPLINSKFLSKLFNTKGASFIILDTDTGEIFFDSAQLNYKSIFNLEYFPKDHSIFFTGIKHKSFFLYRLSVKDKSKNWEVKLADNKFIKAAKRQLIGNDNLIPNQNGNIFWVLDNQLRVFNAKNGRVTSEIDNVKDIDYETNSDILITLKENINVTKANKETLISAYQSDDMSLLWEQPVKVFGKIKKSILVDGRLIVITQTGFDVISLKTGQKQWDKSENLPLLEDVIPTINNQYLVIQSQFLLKIDSTGQKAWKNPIKIFKSDDRGLYFIKQEKDYILSITPSFVHKINSNTGELIGEAPKTLNTSTFAERSLKLFNNLYHVWFDSKENTFLIFSNGRLYQTKVEAKLHPQLLYTFDEKTVPKFERRSNGYFFRQNNQFVYLDNKFNKIYDTTLKKMLKPSLISTTQSLGKQGYRIYSATLGFIPKQIDNAFKSVLVSTNAGILSRSSAFVYGNYHNYTTLYDDFTSLPQVDIGSYLEDDFKTSKKGKTDKDTYIFTTSEEETLRFKSLDKETGQILNLKSTPLKSTDILIDQALKMAYVFCKDQVEIYDLN
ncbi:MAG: hypothetical protein GVY05_09365 [Bacteroidetes bacterium]|jgi:ribosomal protein S8|nr:hypothetical protein [Bacteroidota bacterium]